MKGILNTPVERDIEEINRDSVKKILAKKKIPIFFAGDIIKVQVPESGPNDTENKDLDQALSGSYFIRSLRHHFEISEGKNVTSLNLIRDSYGLK